MEESTVRHSIIPCNDDVEVLFPYRDEESKEIEFDRRPVIAWRVVYHETEYNDNESYAIPICYDTILSLSECIVFYPKKEIWTTEFAMGTLKTLKQEGEEIVKTIERRREINLARAKAGKA